MLTDLEAREALHVLLLSRLSQELRPDAFVLKGGVNLRLFFDSPRYSEDIEPRHRPEREGRDRESDFGSSREPMAGHAVREPGNRTRGLLAVSQQSTLIRLFDSSWRSSTTVEFACPRESRRPSVIDLGEMR